MTYSVHSDATDVIELDVGHKIVAKQALRSVSFMDEADLMSLTHQLREARRQICLKEHQFVSHENAVVSW